MLVTSALLRVVLLYPAGETAPTYFLRRCTKKPLGLDFAKNNCPFLSCHFEDIASNRAMESVFIVGKELVFFVLVRGEKM